MPGAAFGFQQPAGRAGRLRLRFGRGSAVGGRLDGGLLRLGPWSGRQDHHWPLRPEQVRTGLDCRRGLFGADLIAAGQQGGERLLGLGRTRRAAPKEEPAPQRLRRAQPLRAVNLNPAHPHIQREKHDGQFEQPFPQVARLEGFDPVVKKRVVGGDVRLEHLAATRLGQAAQQIGRIVYAGAQRLHAAHLAVLDVHQIQHVRAHILGREPRFVMARADLLEADGLFFAFRTHHHALEVQKIPIVSFLIQGIDADDAFAAVDADVGREIGIVQPPQTPLGDLRPELPVFRPAEPVLRPFRLGVRSEGHRPAQTELPVRQQRVALVRQQGRFRARFLARRNVTPQLRVFRRANAANQFAGGNLLRLERLLVDGRFQNHRRFLDEDLRQLIG